MSHDAAGRLFGLPTAMRLLLLATLVVFAQVAAAKGPPPETKALQRACDKGDAAACLDLGRKHELGMGADLDHRRAADLYRKACSAEVAPACLALAALSHRDDPALAAEMAHAACELGAALGCFALGQAHATGDGVQEDAVAAAAAWDKACGLGNLEGCRRRGVLLVEGEEVPADLPTGLDLLVEADSRGHDPAGSSLNDLLERAEVEEWFVKRCRKGSAPACHRLGVAWGLGKLGEADAERAARFQATACNWRYMRSCLALGEASETGVGKDLDQERAIQLYRKACGGHLGRACTAAAELLGDGDVVDALLVDACKYGDAPQCAVQAARALEGGDGELAELLYRKGCEGGQVDTCGSLGEMYEHGHGVPRDLDEAVAAYQAQCALSASECAGLARMYLAGSGELIKDPHVAAWLLERACADSDPAACYHLGVLHERGLAVDKDLERALELFAGACGPEAPEACYELAVRYDKGRGLDEDVALSTRYHHAACDGGVEAACPRALELREAACNAGGDQDCRLLADLCAHVEPDRAVPLYQWVCDNGDATACFELGDLYASGRGVDQDRDAGQAYHLKGCRNGGWDRCVETGRSLLTGGPADAERAEELLAEVCVSGELTDCRSAVDRLNDAGQASAAARLLEIACRGGDSSSCVDLGRRYSWGTGGMSVSPSLGAEYYEAACALEPSICPEVAQMFFQGSGLEQDRARAAELFAQDCREGPCLRLAYLHHLGDGVDQDRERSREIIERACTQELVAGCVASVVLLGDQTEDDALARARELMEACDDGDGAACGELGRIYQGQRAEMTYPGHGVAQDPWWGARLLEKGCALEDAASCDELGEIYEVGWGVLPDPAKAEASWERSCDLGLETACSRALSP